MMRKTHPIIFSTILIIGFLVVALLFALLHKDSFGQFHGKLPTGTKSPQISIGERHGLILAANGTLWTWGADFLGSPTLGLGGTVNRTIVLRQIGQDSDWTNISAGQSHNLAIKKEGTLWTWGESVHSNRSMPLPVKLPTQVTQDHDWISAAAGGIHSLGIKRDGTLWAWGHNWAGSVGIESTNGSSVPMQVGLATNWDRVWASTVESVGRQKDGSLWYWGDGLDPAFPQHIGKITAPARISADADWVDVGFGVNTVFAIKSDGTLCAFGRNAHYYTGATNTAQNVAPLQVGTESTWLSFTRTTGWWITGLIKRDGSLWMMDASQGHPNGPQIGGKAIEFRRVTFPTPTIASTAGAVHAASPGIHGPIAVAKCGRPD